MYLSIDDTTSKLNRITTMCDKALHLSPYRLGRVNQIAKEIRMIAGKEFTIKKLRPENLSAITEPSNLLIAILSDKEVAAGKKEYDLMLELHHRSIIEMQNILMKHGIDPEARFFHFNGVIHEKGLHL